MASINSVFSLCINNAFQKYGLKKIKGTNIFCRLINGEILQYITYKHLPSQVKGCKDFAVYAGILTVYSESLGKENLLQWGEYIYKYSKCFDSKEVESKYSYMYNEENMVQIVNACVEKAEKIVGPIFESVDDLQTYIEYRKKIRIDILSGAERLMNDSILLIKTNNHEDFMDRFNELLQKEKEQIDKGLRGGTYEELYELYYDGIVNHIVGSRDKVYKDSNLYEKVNKELERRKQENLRILADYGFVV